LIYGVFFFGQNLEKVELSALQFVAFALILISISRPGFLSHRFIELSGYGFWICTGEYHGTKFEPSIGCTAQGRDSTKEDLHRQSNKHQGRVQKSLSKFLNYVRVGDSIVVWKLDPLARSLIHFTNLMTRLKEKGVHFGSMLKMHKHLLFPNNEVH